MRITSLLKIMLASTLPACAAAHASGAGAAPAGGDYCARMPPMPIAPHDAKKMASLEQADASAVIQEALDHLEPGEWLIFAPGVYKISRALVVATAGVTLSGHGATLMSTSATQGGITIRSDGVSIYGFTLDQASADRQSAPWSGGIAIYDEQQHHVRKVRGTVIRDNVVNNAAAAGIFIYSADDFTVAGNTVWRSLADGIHVTAGSANGRVIDNSVSQTGDDMIAVVSYAGSAAIPNAVDRYKDWALLQSGISKNIYIGKNVVSDQYWGRGISVVGGDHITIENNDISRVPTAAAIYLVRESSYRTFGLHDILLRGNRISEVETLPPTFRRGESSPQLTGHGAIEIGSLQDADELSDPVLEAAFAVSGVAIVGNHIAHSRFAGIRAGVGAPGTVSRVLVSKNVLQHVRGAAVIEMHDGLEPATISCSNNSIDGSRSASCAPGAAAPENIEAARGATLHCTASGRIIDRAAMD